MTGATRMAPTIHVRRTSLIALACALVGGTLAFGVIYAAFSRFHIVEDFMATDTGTGYALTRMFPQEKILLAGAALLVVFAILVWLVGLLRDRSNHSD